MNEAWIMSGARTPIGKFMGGLSSLSAPELGAVAVVEAMRRAGVEPAAVDEVILGHVLQAGVGQNPARQAALKAGCPPSVGALTVNKVCGSGLKAVVLAAQAVKLGDAQIVVAGGMESMSQAPYLLPKAREGLRLGNGELIDSMIHDGLTCAMDHIHMGLTGELVSERWGVSREEQDRYAVASHHKAARAWKEGRFAAEVVKVMVKGAKKGEMIAIEKDEGPREDSSIEALAKLRPAFKPDGVVTAGNASTINDGAAALVVSNDAVVKKSGVAPLARIVAYATTGLEPKLVMMTPVEATLRVLAKAGWDKDEVDLFEFNEAFAAQAAGLLKELKLDPEKVNVNGGAVALGHPIGCSGARILVTLLHEMKRRDVRKGVAALCMGGGNGVAVAVERA